MPKEQEAWPKKVIECLECGELAAGMPYFARYCSSGGEHGPTQTVVVLPVSASQPLVEALEGIAAQTTDHVAASRAFAALSDFKAQSEPKEAASAAPEGEHDAHHCNR
jgi:hypothetical protein